MAVIQVKFASWDRVYEFKAWVGGRPIKPDDFKKGDFVVVKTDIGIDLGQVFKIQAEDKVEETTFGGGGQAEELRIVLRKATAEDLEKVKKREASKKEIIDISNDFIKKHNLPMKLVDVLLHFDSGRITFAFIASERIDFRELVKDLSRKFHKSIKMYQIGARQEIVFCSGDIGLCGRTLCCRSFLKEIKSVSTDLIVGQQLSHRGIDRMLGVCGRLKCCLLYEDIIYQELSAKLPAVGDVVRTAQGKGKVVERQLLKETVIVEIENGIVIEVPIKEVNL